MVRTAWLIALLLASFLAPARAGDTELTIVATMHGLHARSAGYSYDTLYALVRKAHPDLIGVEIRQEDLGRDPGYLNANYPKEMIRVAQDWGRRVFGFDWLGDDVAGAPVPADWWAVRSPVKKLERAADANPHFKDTALDTIAAREHNILAAATPQSLNDGRYDALNEDYYARMAAIYAGTPYAELPRFYEERNRRLAEDIAAMITAHPGARVMILTGADHRSALLRLLKARFPAGVQFLPVPD